MAQKYSAVVIQKQKVSSKVYCVTFKLISPQTIEFMSGQNMMVMMGEGVNRTMSIASPPIENTTLLMAHDISPHGLGSQWTEKLIIGDKATLVAPTGGVLSLLATKKRKVLIATGTGIAPFRSIILDKPSDCSIVLYWGLRHEEDLFWSEEFDLLQKKFSNFSWKLIYSKPPDGWTGDRGHVTEYVMDNEKEMENSEFYLCGNKAMVSEVSAKLLERNVPKEQIKTELFY
ncbi:MAG: FAD-binding oxidoreductase [Patescibacteria group bacterium]